MNKKIQKSKAYTKKSKTSNSTARNTKARNTKKAKEVFLTKERLEIFKKNCQKIINMKNTELKEILRTNDQSMTGNKDILLSKVAYGMTFGRIPKCETCNGGRPFFNLENGEYTCKGYQDDTDWVECGEVVQFEDMEPKMLKWEMKSIPTEDEEEDIDSDC